MFNGDGTVTFTPTSNFNGAATLQLHDDRRPGGLERCGDGDGERGAGERCAGGGGDTLAATAEDTPVTYRRPTCWPTTRDVDSALSLASITAFDAVSSDTGGTVGDQRRRHRDLHADAELQRRRRGSATRRPTAGVELEHGDGDDHRDAGERCAGGGATTVAVTAEDTAVTTGNVLANDTRCGFGVESGEHHGL